MQSFGNLFGYNRLDNVWKDKESGDADNCCQNDDDGENFAIFMFTESFLKNAHVLSAQEFADMGENAA